MPEPGYFLKPDAFQAATVGGIASEVLEGIIINPFIRTGNEGPKRPPLMFASVNQCKKVYYTAEAPNGWKGRRAAVLIHVGTDAEAIFFIKASSEWCPLNVRLLFPSHTNAVELAEDPALLRKAIYMAMEIAGEPESAEE